MFNLRDGPNASSLSAVSPSITKSRESLILIVRCTGIVPSLTSVKNACVIVLSFLYPIKVLPKSNTRVLAVVRSDWGSKETEERALSPSTESQSLCFPICSTVNGEQFWSSGASGNHISRNRSPSDQSRTDSKQIHQINSRCNQDHKCKSLLSVSDDLARSPQDRQASAVGNLHIRVRVTSMKKWESLNFKSARRECPHHSPKTWSQVTSVGCSRLELLSKLSFEFFFVSLLQCREWCD